MATTEYVIVLILVALACILALSTLGVPLLRHFQAVSGTITSPVP